MSILGFVMACRALRQSFRVLWCLQGCRKGSIQGSIRFLQRVYGCSLRPGVSGLFNIVGDRV